MNTATNIVRGVVSTEDVDQMARSVIKVSGGAPITLGDVADVQIGAQQPKLGVASEKGHPAVLVTVTKQPDTGTIELTAKIEAALKDLQKNLPADVHVSTDTFRQSRFIESSISNVKSSLYEGAIFVVIVLFLFLANVRTTIISPDHAAALDAYLHPCAELARNDHQHHESRRSGHRYRFAGG